MYSGAQISPAQDAGIKLNASLSVSEAAISVRPVNPHPIHPQTWSTPHRQCNELKHIGNDEDSDEGEMVLTQMKGMCVTAYGKIVLK